MVFANADDDMLTAFELQKRNELTGKGRDECRSLLGKQKTLEDYFFYEGSIDGFEECRNFKKFSDFEKRINELYNEEIREISKSSIKDEILKEQLGIYDKNAKTDDNKVFRLKGVKEQVSFVYERLKLYRGILQMINKIRMENKTANLASIY